MLINYLMQFKDSLQQFLVQSFQSSPGVFNDTTIRELSVLGVHNARVIRVIFNYNKLETRVIYAKEPPYYSSLRNTTRQ